MKEILQILGARVKKALNEKIDEAVDEIRLRSGMPLIITKNGGEYFVGTDGELITQKSLSEMEGKIFIVSSSDIKETMEYVSNHSMYAYEEELRQGYITIQGGHRVGIAGKVVTENGKIKTIKNISSMNIRISKEVKGCADNIIKYLHENKEVMHTLIVSAPGYGKTTLLRDIIRQLSNGTHYFEAKNVAVADERSELAACYHGVVQNDLGIRTDVLDNCPKAEGMITLLRSMSPEIIAVDEIGTKNDIEAIEYVMGGGISVIASVHGNSVEDIRDKPELDRLIKKGVFKRIIFIKEKYGKKERFEIYDSALKQIAVC